MLLALFLGVILLGVLNPWRRASGFRKKERNGNVMLVIAHPDDESMFFGPTLLALCSEGFNVRVLCISSGNADGKGEQRQAEMLLACSVFHIPETNVEVLDLPELQDGFSVRWDIQLIQKLVKERIIKHSIEMLFTFDSYGVSGHPNHRSVHHAVRNLLLELKSAGQHVPETWQLESSSLLRKYSGPLDVYFSLLEGCLPNHIKQQRTYIYSRDPWMNVKAMRQHKSQWVWYRRLFVIFSKYTYVNSLKAIYKSDPV